VLVLALALPAAAATAPPVAYAPPAGLLPAGPLHGSTANAVLPSGRFVTPAGASVVTGAGALGFALSPDGRFALVSNSDDGAITATSSLDPDATTGPSIAVIDTATMTPVSRYRPSADALPYLPPDMTTVSRLPRLHERYLGGIVAVADPADPARTLVLAAGGSSDAVFVFTLDDAGRLTPDARHVIPVPVALDMRYADWRHGVPTALTLSADGRIAYVVDTVGASIAAIDLFTRQLVGAPRPVGFFPSAAALAGPRLLVSNEGMMRYGVVDPHTPAPPFGVPPPALDRASSLSLVDLGPTGRPLPAPPETSGGTSVPMDPPVDGLRIVGGAHPSAIAVTPDARTAFVAMTNVDRIATVALDGVPHVVGGTELRLFDRGPYGTEPVALALSRDASRLYVALRGLDAIAVIDARDPLHLHRLGLIPTGWAPTALALAAGDRTLFVLNQKGTGADGAAIFSTLERIDLATVRLAETTRATLAATRVVVAPAARVPAALKNAIVIVTDHQSFDAAFGAASTMPNLHALADRYALATNFYSDAASADLGHHVLVSGLTTAFAETRTDARDPVLAGADDPEDAPRIGSIFEALARRNLSYRDYGGFLDVAGASSDGYAFDVPAPAALAAHVDLDYPRADPAISDTQRAAAFIHDYDALVATDATPRLAYVWLPGAQPADTDAAIGAMVDHLSHLISWRTTAVIIVSADTVGTSDHVNAARSYALIVSPYAKRRFTAGRHLSTASVLKTLDALFALPPLSLGDLLASDMSDFFTRVPDTRPYTAAHAPTP
jgi:DNA-binding beta-propeller fold protein YncE